MNRRKIIFTGQSGLKAKVCLKTFITNHFPHEESKPHFEDLEAKMYEIYDKNNGNRSRVNFRTDVLSLPVPILNDLWNQAMDDILNFSENKESSKDIFLKLHSCFFHQLTVEYLCPINLSKIKLFNPNLIVTFTDDIYDIHLRLKETDELFDRSLGGASNAIEEILELYRILDWRSKEILLARFIAKELNVDHYIFAVKHNQQALFDLIYNEELFKIYVSHPISEIRRRKFDNQSKKFVLAISELEIYSLEKSVSFFPTTTDELRIESKTQENGKSSFITQLSQRWESDRYAQNKEIIFVQPSLSMNEPESLWSGEPLEDPTIAALLENLALQIHRQITNRDYKLVEQSQCLFVFRPCYEGNPSTGVLNEIDYHFDLKRLQPNVVKPCFIYSPTHDQHLLFPYFLEKEIRNQIKLGNLYWISSDEKHFGFDEVEKFEISSNLHGDYFEIVRQHVKKSISKRPLSLNLNETAMRKAKSAQAQDLYLNIVKKAEADWKETLDRYEKASTLLVNSNDLSIEEIFDKALKHFTDELKKGNSSKTSPTVIIDKPQKRKRTKN